MKEYIDKAAVVAEIKRLKERKKSDWHFDEFNEGYKSALEDILSFLDTLKVKEADIADMANDYYDAFIEKACDYFAPHISDNSGGYERTRIIEGFKKYMKGE